VPGIYRAFCVVERNRWFCHVSNRNIMGVIRYWEKEMNLSRIWQEYTRHVSARIYRAY
jgi:hypothetical protein